jgi:serine/threonine protein kinase
VTIHTSKNATLGKGTYGIVRTGNTFVNNQLDQHESAFKTFLGRDGVLFSQVVLRELVPLCCMPYHPHVLRPRIVFMDDKNRIHFTSERMKCNLLDRLKSHSSTFQQKVVWSLQLLEAVHHMHSNGFLHRDIKLENVFLDEHESVVLGDLGMSRFTSPLISNRFSSGVCTLWTRAPELCSYALDNSQKTSREASYTAAVDCWSLGVTILSILASRYFFQGKDEEDMLRLIFSILGKPDDSDAWGVGRETRTSKSKWKSIAENTSLFSTNVEEVLESLVLECSRRRITAPTELLKSIVPLLALEPTLRSSTEAILHDEFWKKVKKSDHKTEPKSVKWTIKPVSKKDKLVEIPSSHVLYIAKDYFRIVQNESTPQIFESCTTRGVLRLAVTEWISSLRKSLSLQDVTIIDSILLWEKVRDIVDVEVKNEMVLAAACCSLVSKVHEYTLFPSQRWIRCLSNSATVDELLKYETIVIKSSNCELLPAPEKHPLRILSKQVFAKDQERDIILHLCSHVAKNHSKDIALEELVLLSISSCVTVK